MEAILGDHTLEFVDWIADKQAVKYTLSKFLPAREADLTLDKVILKEALEGNY